jgi:phospholipid/cholesterol/gamma-HCH transport system substrate-binding protein
MARTALPGGRGARFRSGVIGVLIFVGLGFALFVALNAQKGLPFTQHGYSTVAFDDVGDLAVGNDVRVAQVRVGRVDRITFSDDQALVRMQLDGGDTEVYRDATARVSNRSGLGQQYVDLVPGTPAAGELGDDEVIATDATEDEVQLLDLATVFDAQTQAAAQTALGQLGNGAAGRGEDLREFLTHADENLPDLGAVARSLAADDGRDLTAMLESLDSLSSRFEGREQEIADLFGQLDTTLAAFNADGGDALGATLDIAPEALSTTRQALLDLQQPLRDTGAAMAALEDGAVALGEATPDLRGVFREAPTPLEKVPGFSDNAEPALEELTPVFTDARPVAPKLTELVGDAASPLQTLAPYSFEISKWFTDAAHALSDGDAAGHWLRFTLLPRTESLTSASDAEDPLRQGDAYPEPGQALEERAEGPLPTDLLPGGDR